jgi:hypothetical protein
MIYNDDVLFLHIPKTAGKSLALGLVETIRRPIVCRVPPGTEAMLRDNLDLEGVEVERSNGHENLRYAERTLPHRGRSVSDFKMILVVIRNPYDLMVSNYHFMRETYEHNSDKANFALAHQSDFETYASTVSFFPVERWLTTADGTQPENLRILRFETLQADFSSALGELGHDAPDLPTVNVSEHDHFTTYLTPASELGIYEKFRYLFDQGYYERLQLA